MSIIKRLKDSLLLWLVFAPLIFGLLFLIALLESSTPRSSRRSSA